MDDAKRRAAIKSKAAKNKETNAGAMGTGSSRPLAKRPMPKVDRAPKKPESFDGARHRPYGGGKEDGDPG